MKRKFIVLHGDNDNILIAYTDSIVSIQKTFCAFESDTECRECSSIQVGYMVYTVKEKVGEVMQKIKKTEDENAGTED